MPWRYHHSVWLIMASGWISLYLVRMGLAPLLGMIMEEFHISYAMAGSLFSAIFYSYGLMQIPSGYIGDRFGRRKILIVGTLLWFFLSLVTAAARTLAMLVFIRFLTGIAQGIYFGNDRPIIVAATPREKMGQGQAISFMGLSLGLFLSVFFAGLIAEQLHNWRVVFLIFSIPSLITSFMVFKYIQEPPNLSPDGKSLTVKTAYQKALTDRDLWLVYLVGFVLLFAYWVVLAWMPSIYEEIGIKTVTGRSLLSGIMGLIGLPGMFFAGIFSDKMLQRGYGRKGFIAVLIAIWAVFMLFIGFFVENRASGFLVSSLFFTSALFVFGVWPPYYALLGEMVPGEIMGTVFGVANFIGFISTWIAPSLTGWLKDTTGSFSASLYLSGIMLVLGAILTLWIRPGLENRCGQGAREVP